MQGPSKSRNPDQRILSEMVRRIVESVQPLRVILFGSAARGELGPNSDLDVLVVMPDGVHRRQTAQKIYRDLRGLGFAKDIVVVTESDVREYSNNPSLILHSALREGKELYRAAG
jgi:predicted nucleotidyltransferase